MRSALLGGLTPPARHSASGGAAMMFQPFPRARFAARVRLPLLIAGLLGATALAAAQPPGGKQANAKSNGKTGPVGLNLSAVNDWSREWVFTDLYKASRPWTLNGPG